MEQRTHTRARVGYGHYNNFVFALDRKRKQREYPARKRSFAPVAAAAADDYRLAEVALGIIYFKIFAVFEQLFFAREQTHAVIVPAGAAARRAELSAIKRLERGYIFKLIERLTERGRGVILISSYLPEVMGLSDRLIVMAQGKITAEYDKEALKTLTEADVLRMASIED